MGLNCKTSHKILLVIENQFIIKLDLVWEQFIFATAYSESILGVYMYVHVHLLQRFRGNKQEFCSAVC